jgi:chorismate mutase
LLELKNLREKLDVTNQRIITKLKDRSRFPLNEAIYVPDSVQIKGRSGISLLEFAMEGIEVYHSSLGRYDYHDQYPVFSRKLPGSLVERVTPPTPIQEVQISISTDLLAFYKETLPRLCKSTEDPTTYGETAYVDADMLQLIHERINSIGRYVAQVKLDGNRDLYKSHPDADTIRNMLKDARREGEVIEKARKFAITQELDPDLTGDVVRWVIDKTLEVEVKYIQMLEEKALPTVTQTN